MKNKALLLILCFWLLNVFFVLETIADDKTENIYQLIAKKNLGNLLLSSDLRTLLDKRRNDYTDSYPIPVLTADSKTKTEIKADIVEKDPVVLTLHGLLIRGDGEHSVWYNNKNTFSSDMAKQNISIELDYIKRKNAQVPVIINGQKIVLKPGQTWKQKGNSLIEQFNK